MKICKFEQYRVYKNEDEYYVCLGLRNNLVYLNLRSMEGELKQIKQQKSHQKVALLLNRN